MRSIAAVVACLAVLGPGVATGREGPPDTLPRARLGLRGDEAAEAPAVQRRHRPVRPPKKARYAQTLRVRPVRPRTIGSDLDEPLPMELLLLPPLEFEPPPALEPFVAPLPEPEPRGPSAWARLQERLAFVPWGTLRVAAAAASTGLFVANLAPMHLAHADRFLGANTQRFEAAHRGLEIAGAAAFAVSAGATALDAEPATPLRLAATGAAALLVATQAGLLAGTEAREGRANQQAVSRAHLAFAWLGLGAAAFTTWTLVF